MTDEPAERKKFEIPQKFQDHVGSLGQEAADAIGEHCRRVEELVVKLEISDQCTGFVTDGDLAISWGHYWTEERRLAKSVSRFRIALNLKAVLDAAHRVHPSSCPGHSNVPGGVTCIRL